MRKLKGEVEEKDSNVAVAEDVIATPPAVPMDAMSPGDKGAKPMSEFKPYLGRDSLPPAKKDAKGNIVGRGEPRYFVVHNGGGNYDLMRTYRKRCGVGRESYRVLHLKSRDKKKAALDKAFLVSLRKLGIPGSGDGVIR